MALFTQYWYWYPLVHFISLSFAPTTVIGLNRDLKMPKNFTFRSNARPSLFAYPPVLEETKEEEVKKVPTAQLSISAKAKAKAAKKKKEGEEEVAMDVDEDGDKEAEEVQKQEEPKKKEHEPSFEVLQNPARVTPAQRKRTALDETQRYLPVKKVGMLLHCGERQLTLRQHLAGIVMLKDTHPEEPEDLIVFEKLKAYGVGEEEEPEPPKPFEFNR
jgi:26S proteasome regulatory subunit N2